MTLINDVNIDFMQRSAKLYIRMNKVVPLTPRSDDDTNARRHGREPAKPQIRQSNRTERKTAPSSQSKPPRRSYVRRWF